MPTKTLTPEQALCFQSAIELACAAIVNGTLSSEPEAVKEYISKIISFSKTSSARAYSLTLYSPVFDKQPYHLRQRS